MVDLAEYINDYRYVIDVDRKLKYRIESYDDVDKCYNLRCQLNNNVVRPLARYVENVNSFSEELMVYGVKFKFMK